MVLRKPKNSKLTHQTHFWPLLISGQGKPQGQSQNQGQGTTFHPWWGHGKGGCITALLQRMRNWGQFQSSPPILTAPLMIYCYNLYKVFKPLPSYKQGLCIFIFLFQIFSIICTWKWLEWINELETDSLALAWSFMMSHHVPTGCCHHDSKIGVDEIWLHYRGREKGPTLQITWPTLVHVPGCHRQSLPKELSLLLTWLAAGIPQDPKLKW